MDSRAVWLSVVLVVICHQTSSMLDKKLKGIDSMIHDCQITWNWQVTLILVLHTDTVTVTEKLAERIQHCSIRQKTNVFISNRLGWRRISYVIYLNSNGRFIKSASKSIITMLVTESKLIFIQLTPYSSWCRKLAKEQKVISSTTFFDLCWKI